MNRRGFIGGLIAAVVTPWRSLFAKPKLDPWRTERMLGWASMYGASEAEMDVLAKDAPVIIVEKASTVGPTTRPTEILTVTGVDHFGRPITERVPFDQNHADQIAAHLREVFGHPPYWEPW